MKYKTSDLSKVLNVSSNTIRRYEEKGYFNSVREEENGYRYFDNEDVAKLMYISKYRKFDFSHEEIADVFQGNITFVKKAYQDRMDELDEKIATMTAIRHMLKDDLNLIKRIDVLKDDITERICNSFYYVPYQENGKLITSGEQGKIIHKFLYECPEIKYVYIFPKDSILKGELKYNEGFAIKQKHAESFGVDPSVECISEYPARDSVMSIVKLPLDFLDEKNISRKDVRQILYGNLTDYMEKMNYTLIGDGIGIKIAHAKEDGKDIQYILMSMPVSTSNLKII